MSNNPYDTSLEWMNFHNQQTEDIHKYEPALYPLTPAYEREKVKPAPPLVKSLSKSDALKRVGVLKGAAVVASLLGFGTLGALVAGQMLDTTLATPPALPANQPASAPNMQNPSGQGQFPSSNGGGFFHRHHQDQNQGQGPDQGQGGYGFGQGNSSGPSTDSRTS